MAKKFLTIIFSLAIGLFIATNAYALNAAVAQGGNPDNWYIEVEYNDGGGSGAITSASHGDVLEWDLDSDTGETLGYTVHKCDEADAENIAGVVPSWDDTARNLRENLKDGDVFLMQIRGYHSAINTDGTVTAGQSLASGLNGTISDGDGNGFAFITDSADTTNVNSGTSAKVWIDFD